MEAKKPISFGFKKTKKAEKPIAEEKKDYIECLEEKSIKVVGGEAIQEEKPLIIPMKPNTLITAERLKEIAEKVEKDLVEPESEITPVDVKETPANETLDQMVVRELLEESKIEKVETSILTVPIPAKPVMDGQKESSLDDYEAVPIQDFGLAMLRGMGWTPSKDQSKYKQPQLRPKGLGLGADKVISENQKKKSTKDKEEELSIVKNSFVKITTGKYSGYYGKVVSLDEDNGRVMVDITIKKETVSLSEFMMHPVTKAEFDKESKVINQGSYEKYKKNEKSQKARLDSTKVERGKSRRESPKAEREKSRRESPKVEREKSRHESPKVEREKSRRESPKVEREKSRHDSPKVEREKSRHESPKVEREGSSSQKSNNASKEHKKEPKESKSRDNSSNDRNRDRSQRHRKDSTSSEERSRKKKKKDKKRYSSTESLSSLSDSEKKRKHKSKKRFSSESDSDRKNRRRSVTSEGKRDIDKKRKGKKKKRDRDRSPNYRKHRK